MGFPDSSVGKESACNLGDPGLIPASGRSPGEEHGYPLSILAWRTPWTEEPGRLQSKGSQRFRCDWVANTFSNIFLFSMWEKKLIKFIFLRGILLSFLLGRSSNANWRRKWQPTPVFLPRESQGWGSLVGCRLRGRTESDTTEVT